MQRLTTDPKESRLTDVILITLSMHMMHIYLTLSHTQTQSLEMHMYITPLSGARALIQSQRGNKPHSEQINSTRGLFSTLEIIGNWMGGGGGQDLII